MLVVVVIIGILAGVLVPRLIGARERASDAGSLVKIWQAASAVELYAQDNGAFPIAIFHFFSTAESTIAMLTGIAPYISVVPKNLSKGIAALMNATSSCVLTGDSFAYASDASWKWFAITALSESKKGNSNNCLWVIDSNKQGLLQVVGKWLSYAYGFWLTPTIGVTQILDDLIIFDGTNTYIINEKNLWASIAGTGIESYGSYFQRGNNSPFPNQGAVSPFITTLQTNALSFEPSTFESTSFIGGQTTDPYDWAIPQNNNLRWWVSGNKQWPCPPMYHVPTQEERSWLVKTWQNIYSGNEMYQNNKWILFMNTLKLPMALDRDYGSPTLIRSWWPHGSYWSATANSSLSYDLYLMNNLIDYNDLDRRARGFSIRCFKN